MCPVQTVELLQSIRFLTLQLQVDSKGVLTLFSSHPDVLIRGTPSIFEALLAILPMGKGELKVCGSVLQWSVVLCAGTGHVCMPVNLLNAMQPCTSGQ